MTLETYCNKHCTALLRPISTKMEDKARYKLLSPLLHMVSNSRF